MTLDKTTLTAEMLDRAIECMNNNQAHDGKDTAAVGAAVTQSVQANTLLLEEYSRVIIGEESMEVAFKFAMGAGVLLGWRLREEAGETRELEKLFDKSAN